MEATGVIALGALALVDSTSFGTLGVPLWMLAQPSLGRAAVLTYLAVIAGFYWCLGLLLLGGAGVLRSSVGSFAAFAETRPVLYAQLLAGGGLFVASFFLGRSWAERRRARRGGRPSRVERLTTRAVGPAATLRTVGGVAVGAGVIEAASMLPYLAAIGVPSTAGLGYPASAAVLLAYVVVMIAPAAALFAARVVLDRRAAPLLARLNGALRRHQDEALAWIVGVVGFLLAADAIERLQLLR